ALQAINVSENNDYYSSQDGILFNKNKSVLIVFPARNAITEYTIPDRVKSVYDYAFTDCSNLQSVIISENMVEIELGAFYNCTALESVTISDSITTIGYNAFENCTALASITIPETVTTIENDAFKDCSALQSVMIPESVTELGYGAFDECSNLESITILNPICDFVERELLIGGPASPVEDTIPSTTVIYGYEFSTAKAYAEENGNEFISLGEKEIIGELGTNLTWTFDTATGTLTISGTGGMKNFYDTANSPTWSYLSENIKKVVIEDGVTSIGDEAFFGYSSLESVSIPDSLTSIGKYAFGYCTSLESVILPESVEYIGYHAFCDCSGLEAITIKNPDCEIYDGILGYCTISEAAVIYGYENSTAQAYAEKYDRNFISLTEMLTGDANGDGEFNILDIITLQKWLLGTGDLPNWQAVDFNQDGIINIFDLVLAKKYYLNI
ncbi:MAG: leucine-rich repeat protein, partial [Oscillospiraceae bacterium]|nr:leucine-rich repeat protein [Oscillospiraceae bacterium]